MARSRICVLTAEVAGWLVAAVLAWSAVEHWRNPWTFLNSIHHYQIVAGGMAVVLAVVLPPLHLALATMIIARYGRGVALAGAAGLFLVYALAQGWALVRGLDIACGCSGSWSYPVSGWTIGFDACFCPMALWAWGAAAERIREQEDHSCAVV